jgi:ABC-2 type transport system ATP-binding protein
MPPFIAYNRAVSRSFAIELSGLHKRFDSTVAVDQLDLRVPSGCFYGLLGPNGAGKSTTIAMLTGLLRPGGGRIRLLGRDYDADDPWFKARTGLVGQRSTLFSRLTGLEQLELSARLYGLTRSEARHRSVTLLELFSLASAAKRPIAEYSRGMRRKLAIACALIHAPALLFLDEPFEGVDALSAQTIFAILAELVGQGATVLLTTHILEVAERLCQRVGILHRGQLAREVEVAALTKQTLRELFIEIVGAETGQKPLPDWLTRPADDAEAPR